MAIERIVLIGFSGAGKTTVGRLLAGRLGWRLIDTDAEIEREAGITIPEIFARDGEPSFRERERRHLLTALSSSGAVIPTGGGATVDPALWTADLLNASSTLVVALDARPETVLDRLRRQQAAEGAAVARPMITGDDPLTRINELKGRRQEVYDRAGITLIVDSVSPGDVATEILSLIEDRTQTPSVVLQATSGHSDIVIAPGATAYLGAAVRTRWPNTRRAWVISDESVAALHGETTLAGLIEAGFTADLRSVAVGEGSKSWATTGTLYDWLLGAGVERGDVVVALGGGVIGDLAGFVAATVLRGIGLVQVPTSLLAMVDSSVGGKTGINHAAGKNLIGAFYQPSLVSIDPTHLATLPPRELATGWAEIIKHAVIQISTPGGERGDLLDFLERNVAGLARLREPAMTYLIRRNVALKTAVVQADERETGIRAYLNFGHTLGHGIEAAGYRYLHGEAIAVGMRAALMIGEAIGGTDGDLLRRVDRLITAFGLPRTAEVDPATVLAKIGSDKKRISGVQRWVMPASTGGVEIRTDVPAEVVRTALGAVTR